MPSGKRKKVRRRRWMVRVGRGLLIAAAAAVLFSGLQVLLLRWWAPPFTADMLFQAGRRWVRDQPYRKPAYLWRDLNRISPHLRRAVLAGEDQRFLHHDGFDLIEIRNAVDDLLVEGRLRGASTISMQCARSVFLPHSRTVWRKAAEAYYTLLIECLWAKPRILEMYLNTVDWGDDIRGAEAASRAYFRKSARSLTARESALLAAILPNPHAFAPDAGSPFVSRRSRRILADMRKMPLL